MSELEREFAGDMHEGHTHSWGFLPIYVLHVEWGSFAWVRGAILPGTRLRAWVWEAGGYNTVRAGKGWLNLIEERT